MGTANCAAISPALTRCRIVCCPTIAGEHRRGDWHGAVVTRYGLAVGALVEHGHDVTADELRQRNIQGDVVVGADRPGQADGGRGWIQELPGCDDVVPEVEHQPPHEVVRGRVLQKDPVEGGVSRSPALAQADRCEQYSRVRDEVAAGLEQELRLVELVLPDELAQSAADRSGVLLGRRRFGDPSRACAVCSRNPVAAAEVDDGRRAAVSFPHAQGESDHLLERRHVALEVESRVVRGSVDRPAEVLMKTGEREARVLVGKRGSGKGVVLVHAELCPAPMRGELRIGRREGSLVKREANAHANGGRAVGDRAGKRLDLLERVDVHVGHPVLSRPSAAPRESSSCR